MATEQYDGYSPQVADDWPSTDMSQLQHGPVSNPAVADPAGDDLAYKPNTRGNSFNNPPPNGWLYPHKKGIGTGSNLEPFKAEIEARTQRGENCKAIAAALNAMGVQTSDRAVSRVRIRWGMRKRAQRKVKTPPPDADTARLSAKSKVQAMRKAELIRMTKEGMSPEEIYQSLTSRGMELKKGVATVLRLQSAWGVARDEKRWLGNFRHQCHKKAKAQQEDAFTDIAKELGVQDIKGWAQEKMKEQAARQARHELALKLMGEHAPTNPERRKLQKPRRANGPFVQQAQANDDEGGSDIGSSEDELESGSDFPGPVTDLRFGLVESARQADQIPGSDGPLPSPHDLHNGEQPVSYAAASTTNNSSGVGVGVEAGEYHDYPPLHDQPDDTMYGSEDDQHGMASVASRVSSHMVDPMAQSTSGPHLPMVQNPPSSNEMMASAPPYPNPLGSSVSSQPPEARSTQTAPTTTVAMVPGYGEKHPTQVDASITSASKPTASVTSGLVLPPEEAEANKSTLSTLDHYNDAARVYKELLEARNNNKPLPGSLTGMPPSAKEVDSAKRKLKEATQAMMLALD
ncbi:hypothetical protein SLS64_013844 [Diaporthe eres]|uniref:Clr5 domain-containing protein n=1 Tax=Diaporthe eres TaxID=83184 RepID=A0ABR1NWB1_DIAER